MTLRLRIQVVVAVAAIGLAGYVQSLRFIVVLGIVITCALFAPGRILAKFDLFYNRDFAYLLISSVITAIVYVVPRSTLRAQSEKEFVLFGLRLMFTTLTTSLFLWWILSSVLDLARELIWKPPLLKLPDVRSGETQRVGLCLSGGGYRAALFHAGLLEATMHFKLSPSRLSTVSGGSIVGAAYALGIHPRSFPALLLSGRLDLKRALFRIQNIVALFFNRSRAQSALLDRVLFANRRFSHIRKNVQLLVGCTDLLSGTGVGISSDFWVRQLHVSLTDRLAFSNVLGKRPLDIVNFLGQDLSVASVVAASGAFPLAFNALPIRFSDRSEHECLLADGGIVDNTGINLLLGAHRYAAEPPSLADAFRGAPSLDEWRLEFVLVSDAGASFEGYRQTDGHIHSRLLRDFARAVDVIHANVAPRWDGRGMEDPIVIAISAGAWIEKLRMIEYELRIGIKEAASPSGWLDTRSAKTWAYLVATLPLSDKVDVLDAERLGLAKYRNELQHPRQLGEELLKRKSKSSRIRGQADSPLREKIPDDNDLDRLIIYDLMACVTTFIHTSTIRANFDGEEVSKLFRLGRYLFALEWDKIREAYLFYKRAHRAHQRMWSILSSHSTAAKDTLSSYFRFEYAYYRLQQPQEQNFWTIGKFDKYSLVPHIARRNLAAMLSFRIAQLENEQEPLSLVIVIRGPHREGRFDIPRLLSRSADLCGAIGVSSDDFVDTIFSIVVAVGTQQLPHGFTTWFHERGKSVPF